MNQIIFLRIVFKFPLFLCFLYSRTHNHNLTINKLFNYTNAKQQQLILNINQTKRGLSFGHWLKKKIITKESPIKLKGSPWLPFSASNPELCPKLSFDCVLYSSIQRKTHIMQRPQVLLPAIPIQSFDPLAKKELNLIRLDNISNLYVFYKLNDTFSFENLPNTPIANIRQEIKKLTNKMRLSGYFSKIQISYKTNKSNVVFSIDIELYPILQKIEFYQSSQLLIPYSTLYSFSFNQIGYPRSLTQLSLLIEKIRLWYCEKGYCWVSISPLQKKTFYNSETLKIIEGVANKITYKICPLINHPLKTLDSLERFIPLYMVNKIVKSYIQYGSLLNTSAVEKLMSALKDTNLFYNSYYDIKFRQETGKIEFIIYFIPFQDSETKFTLNKIAEKISSLGNHEQELKNFLSLSFQDENLIIFNTCSFKKIIFTETPTYSLDKILIYSDLNNYLQEHHLGLDENLELYKHNSQLFFSQDIRYARKKFDFINFTFKEKDFVSEFNLSYTCPGELQLKTSIPFSTSLFSTLTHVFPEKTYLKLNSKIYSKKLFCNLCSFRRKGIEILSKQNFISGDQYSCMLGKRTIVNRHLNYKRENSLQRRLNIVLAINKYSQKLLNNPFVLPKNISRKTLQNFKMCSLRLVLPYIDSFYKPTKGKFTQIDFVQCHPNWELLKTTNYATSYKSMCLLFLKQIIYLRSTVKQYTNYPFHLFVVKVFQGNLIGNKLLLSLPDRSRYQKYIMEHTGFPCFRLLSSHFGEYLIEYHWRIFKYTNPLVFIKLIKNSPLLEEYPFPHVQGEFFYSKRLDLSPLCSGYYIGVGWEFRTMISQIPPVRIEFAQKILGRGKFFLRVVPYLY